MQTETYSRRPFDVNAVQVTPQNAEYVAIWCSGFVGTGSYKVMGQSVSLVTVMVPGNGPNKGKMIEAKIGSWVVELNGQFRVYREKQFREEFEKVQTVFSELKLRPEDLVEVIDPKDPYYGFQGEVEFVEQTCITMPGVGGCMYNPFDLKRIDEYSDETKLRIKNSIQLIGEENEALDKINTLRAAAEAAFKDGVVSPEEARQTMQGDLANPFEIGKIVEINGSGTIHDGHRGTLMARGADFSEVRMPGEEVVMFANGCVEPDRPPVTEINGIKTGYKVRVKLAANDYYGETGVVIGLGKDGVRVLVLLDEDNHEDQDRAVPDPLNPTPVAFQADELEVVEKVEPLMEPFPTLNQVNEDRAKLGFPPIEPTPDLAYFKQDDMVETLSEHVIDGLEIPAGTTGRVTVVGIDLGGSDRPGVEVLFSDGTYGHFLPERIKKI